jgi:lipid II:glycine glycyltransferase (peptidoglycan interpeptide bridge formation enzyme)
MFKNLSFSKAPIYMHSERVWVLPLLDKSEDELLSGMRKTTRYLIRRAPSQNVQVEVRTDKKALEDFWKIYKVTADRERFTPFSERYIEHEFDAFAKSDNAVFLFGYHDGQPLASALIVFTATTAFYHQGASIHSPHPVTYALQWRAIQEAKARGCSTYNFWGILQEGRTPKSWEGLTLFKKGFGGQEVDYVPTQDYVLSPAYALTYLFERYLAMKRGV